MNLKTIKEFKGNLKGEHVLVRVDFNVPMEKGVILDDFRIRRSLPTIDFLRSAGARLVLISHLTKGRAETLRPVAGLLKAPFLEDIFSLEARRRIFGIKEGEMVLCENIRNYSEEEKNISDFAKSLAELGSIFVNDAFSVSHRTHASIVGLPQYMPSYAGLLFEEEFENLRAAFSPPRPSLLVLGGIKFKTKLGVLDRFLETADKIFVGGALANNFFRERGDDIGSSIVDSETGIKKYAGNKKIILPLDVKKEDGAILDCGQKTIEMLGKLARESKFILWNGPLGDYERPGFERGTFRFAELAAASEAKSIIGGGDTISAVRKAGGDGLLNKFSFVSTAGGAMLEFLSRGTLPGIRPLLRQDGP